MIRRFEFIGGSSAKFWEISVNGANVNVRYGRLGTSGQQQDKVLPDSASASKHAEKLIAEKIGKGYSETAAV
ncbi:MAG TPA: WGR domain-containing protein [Pirellulales bacterium]